MKRCAAWALGALLTVASFSQAEEAKTVKSGLEPGASVAAFNVRDITGPSKGETLCYRCRYGARPVVTIFARDIDDNLASLIKKVDTQVGENSDKQMKAFVVLLTENPDKDAARLEKLAKDQGVKNVPLTVFDGQAGPPEYKIAKDAHVNVMMWVGSKVKVNEAFAKDGLTKEQVEALAKSTGKILN